MIKLLLSAVLISSASYGSLASKNLFECHTDHSSIHLKSVASGEAMQMTIISESGETIKTSVYLTGLSSNQKVAVQDGSFGLPFASLNNKIALVVIENNSAGKLIQDGFIQNMSCQKI